MAISSRYDPRDPTVQQCPYAAYAELRREDPVHEVAALGYHLVTRASDVREVLRHPEIFSSNLVAVLLAGADGRVRDLRTQGGNAVDVLATADPPAHDRQRQIINRTLNIRRIQALAPMIAGLVAELLTEGCSERPVRAETALLQRPSVVEWMSMVAVPLPIRVIAELLDLPVADLPRLKQWSDHGVALLSGVATAEELMSHVAGIVEMQEYLDARFEREMADPGPGLVGDLVREHRATSVDAGLTRNEALAILQQLVIAGTESTTSLIGSAARLLSESEELQQELRRRPEKLSAFVEEAVRLESPFQGHFRVVRQDSVLAGRPVPAGTRLMLSWASANRDAECFERPDEVVLDRPVPRGHLAFGEGIHYCVGAPLARLETQLALEALLRTSTRIVPASTPTYVRSLFVRRLSQLPIELWP